MASGSQNNTTYQAQKWTNLRAFTIGNTAKDVDGTVAVSWSKDEILGASTDAYFLRGDKTWSNSLSANFSAGTYILAGTYLQARNHMYLDAGHFYMKYNNTWYDVLHNHVNGNISVNAAGTGLYVGYYNTTLVDWMSGRMQLKDGCLSIFPNSSNYREGIRIHSVGSWSDITLCGNDNTGDSGISANSWFIGNNNGNFYIARNGSPGSTAWLECVNNIWSTMNPLWIKGGSTEAGGNVNRLTTSSGMPGNMQYNTSRRGTQIYSNGIAFADPYNGNSNNDAGWIRHQETSVNAGELEIAVGDDGDETIVVRQYNTSNNVARRMYLLNSEGFTSVSNQSTDSSYAHAAMQIREANYAGASSDTWGVAPRLAWYWSGRVAAQIGLASNGWLYEAPSTGTNFYKIVCETGTWGIGITGNAATATKWTTARTITLTGSVTGSVSIDGSGNVSLTTTTNHNHDWRYPQNHITSFAFTGNNRPLSRYVTFDLNAPAGGPGGWINGFMSVHNDYLASYIVQVHRSDDWYLGWNQYSTSNSTVDTAPVWRKIIHSGNIGSQSVNYATSAGSVNTHFTYKRVIAFPAASNPAAGWRRVCKVSARENYAHFMIGVNGGWNNGGPSNAIIACTTRHTGATLTLIACGFKGLITSVRLVNVSGNTFWVDAYMSAQSNAVADQTLEFWGNVSISEEQNSGAVFSTSVTAAASVDLTDVTGISLTSNNYTSYTVTKTGGGASGSWGINVTGSSTSCTGNAKTATTLQTARNINGTSFNGSANITTANWGTARNFTIKDYNSNNAGTAVSVNGSGAVTLLMPSTIYCADVRSGNTRIVSDWIGFYQSNNAGGKRYGYIECDVNRMYFRKENSSTQDHYFDFGAAMYVNGAIGCAGAITTASALLTGSGITIRRDPSSGQCKIWFATNAAVNKWRIGVDGNDRFSISAYADGEGSYDFWVYNNGACYYKTSIGASSRYIKHNIRLLTMDTGNIIDRMEPVSFVFNNDQKETTNLGFIYEDLVKILPEVCFHGEGEDNNLGINYTGIIPVLVKEIQSLRKRLATIETELNSYKSKT